MTVVVTTQVGDHDTYVVTVSDPAKEAIRFTFNPSAREDVQRLKALAAAFITEADKVMADKPEAGREMAVAKTHMQTASMWAVLGATKGL